MAITLHDYRFIFHKVGGQDVVFEIANQDTDNATYRYYGYLAETGAWIIQRFHLLTNARIYEYAAGKTVTDYISYWASDTGRYIGSLTFQRFDQISTL